MKKYKHSLFFLEKEFSDLPIVNKGTDFTIVKHQKEKILSLISDIWGDNDKNTLFGLLAQDRT